MKNVELIALAKEIVEGIFSEKKKMGTVKIDVKSTDHNGAFVRVCDIVDNPNGYKEYWQIGSNCEVFAIAGKDNIVKKLNMMYDWHAGKKCC